MNEGNGRHAVRTRAARARAADAYASALEAVYRNEAGERAAGISGVTGDGLMLSHRAWELRLLVPWWSRWRVQARVRRALRGDR